MKLYIMHFPPISYYFQSLKLWTDQHCSQINPQSSLNVTEQVSTTRAATKLMPPILLCWPTTSEVNVADMAVEVEPSR